MRGLILVALVALPARAAEWTRVFSPQIEVLTDSGERTGRQVLARFDQIRRIFRQANAPGSPLALRVFVFASEKDFRSYRDGAATEGFYQSAPERDYVALYAGSGVGRAIVHEYVHLILSHSSSPLPKWFEEGTAEFYSTIEIERDRMSIGPPIESHLTALASERWFTAKELAGVTHASPRYDDRSLVGMFYAQSWALVHMLNLSPAYRGGMPEFALLLSEGRAPEQAFAQSFGKSMEGALADLAGYVRTMRPATVAAPPEEAAPQPGVQRLTPIEAILARADLALQVRRNTLARTLFEQAVRERPDSAAAAAGIGSLALAEGRKEDGRRSLERAIALGDRDAGTYFEVAMLERETGAPWARVDALLKRTVALNPNFAEAHFLLGARATDDGDYATAIGHLREALRVLPRQSYFWHALGYAQAKLGMRQEAAESARRALASSVTEEHERMAQTLLRQLAEPLPAPVESRPAVSTSASWQRPKGDSRIEGVLTQVDCLASSAQLHIAAGTIIVLKVRNPGEVELVNAPEASYQFSCGPQNLRVAVEYRAESKEVTRIEFLR
jgi:tetratricopeptide (TPR) repeat protein